jgi:hypothetical protein
VSLGQLRRSLSTADDRLPHGIERIRVLCSPSQ